MTKVVQQEIQPKNKSPTGDGPLADHVSLIHPLTRYMKLCVPVKPLEGPNSWEVRRGEVADQFGAMRVVSTMGVTLPYVGVPMFNPYD